VAQFLQINCTRRRSFINKYTYYHAAWNKNTRQSISFG
jgi:hypothetical protein